jgi:nucleotide-binding universal stress UspA family protein
MATTDRSIIVVGTDFSEQADRALDRALREAGRRAGAEVHVVHVAPDAAKPWLSADAVVDHVQHHTCQCMDRMLGDVDDAAIPRVVAHYRHGSPVEGIAKLAIDLGADLIIVGAHGAGHARPFLGSVAEGVARLARCPVLFVSTDDPIAAPRTKSGRFSLGRPVGAPRRSYASDGIHAAQVSVFESAIPR